MRSDGFRVRIGMGQAGAEVLSPLDHCLRMARAIPWVWVALPAGPTDLDWQSVLFTGRETARASIRGEQARIRRVDPLRVMITALRSGRERLVVDPGLPSRMVLTRPLIRLLFREYALRAMERRGGAWVLTNRDRIQTLEIGNRAPYLPLYLGRRDALPQVGEVPSFRRWAEIRRGCLESATDRALLHAGQPEQVVLHRWHLARAEGRADGGTLARLEQALARRQGMAEITRLLASLEWIWAPVLEGEVVPVWPERNRWDLFTSAAHAEGFLRSVQWPAGELVKPRLVSTRPLFERLIRSRMPVVINAGCSHQWQVHAAMLEPALAAGGAAVGRPAGAPIAASTLAGVGADWLLEE